MTHPRATSLALGLIAALGAALGGCSGGDRSEPGPAEPRVRAGAAGRARGVQISSWVIDNRAPLRADPEGKGAGLPLLFEPYVTRPVPFPPQTVESWRREGLRVVSVPRADVNALREQLRLTGPLQQQYFGELARWTVIHSGAESEFPMVIEQSGGPLRLSAGELRLLARAYIVPGEVGDDGTTRAAMRLELAVQHFDPSQRQPDSIDLTAVRRVPVEGEGPLLRSLSASALTDGADAIIIFADEPTPAQIQAAESAGPLPPVYPRVGEAMLTDYSRLPNPSVRTLLVIEPLVPARYELSGF